MNKNKIIKIFAVADIHGHATAFKNALSDSGFEKNNPDHLLVVCGDCFDRGRENREVLRFLKSIKNKILVRGNHEDKLMRVLSEGRMNSVDYHNGTDVTVKEFLRADEVMDDGRIYPSHDVVERLRDFVRGMQDYFETEKYIFVHGYLPIESGTLPPIPLADWRYAPNSVWPCARFTGWQEIYPLIEGTDGKTVVCGHRSASYASDFDPDRTADDYSPFISDGIAAIDACTIVSGRVNVLVLEDSVPVAKEHEMKLLDLPFESMKNGEKTIEMRLFDDKRRCISVGDKITFIKESDGELFRTRVTGLYRYDDFYRLADDFESEDLGFPGKSSYYVAGYMNSIYPNDKISTFGCLAIRICVEDK